MGSDFANGNLAQGLVDSLNLYLPALALANSTDQTNQAKVAAPLEMNSAAFIEAETNAAGNLAPNAGNLIDFQSPSTTPPPNAASLTVTSQGATSKISVAPASSVSSSSAPLVVVITPETAEANLGSGAPQVDASEVLAALGSTAGAGAAPQGAATGASPLILNHSAFNTSWDTGLDPTFSDLETAANEANAAATPDTISASVGAQTDSLMQFLQSVKNNIRAPDYITFTVNFGPLVGGTVAVSVDRYGELFVGPGVEAGKSSTILSGSLTANWMNQTSTPSQAQLYDMLTGSGFNFTGGSIRALSESYTPGTGWATGGGVASPQIGGGYTYGFKLTNLGVGW